jgi:hypothetical protein
MGYTHTLLIDPQIYSCAGVKKFLARAAAVAKLLTDDKPIVYLI